MRSRLLAVVIFAIVLLVAPAWTIAQEASPVASPIAGSVLLPPDATIGGLTLGEWSSRSWQWFFSFPEVVNPLADTTGERCGYGQSGPVFFLAGADASVERRCTVPLGTTVFVPLAGSECSTVEPPPFFGRDEAELTACAIDALNHVPPAGIADMRLSVDGRDVGDLAAYRVTTPLFSLALPAGNLLGTDLPVANSVADGYQVLLGPLPEGDHLVEIAIPGPVSLIVITYRLTIVAPQVVE